MWNGRDRYDRMWQTLEPQQQLDIAIDRDGAVQQSAHQPLRPVATDEARNTLA
jgi:hypothetical protein